MPKFNQDKINSIFLRVPDLRYLLNQSFRKVTGICPLGSVFEYEDGKEFKLPLSN
jgi:hypothetical protein